MGSVLLITTLCSYSDFLRCSNYSMSNNISYRTYLCKEWLEKKLRFNDLRLLIKKFKYNRIFTIVSLAWLFKAPQETSHKLEPSKVRIEK
jgi:hypothetical protein